MLLTADTTDDLVVLPRSGLTVRDAATRDRLELPDNGARQWRVAVGDDGVNRVAYLTGAGTRGGRSTGRASSPPGASRSRW